ncbi:unnamed protein product [Didymodactylos carnosus]|uniref:Tc1-like transposase DDE domain-containing protein n=1 Tax=Didymodactylos carnosus TaxID=1234261 RepID=A0A8S2EQF7_9BILA|nr:unnamed protein product [Didymodactylos carnosus]CAF4039760.1 unnamed protein product [Didymodactylos carnosus]
MYAGHSFTKSEKEIFFKVITYIEAVKNGIPLVPLSNTTKRLKDMLGISRIAVFNIKEEMHRLQAAQKKEEDEEPPRQRIRSETHPPPTRKRQHSAVSSTCSTMSSSATISSLPVPLPPKKKGEKNRIALILDNATWHFEESDGTKLPRRGSEKNILHEWLRKHKIVFDNLLKNSELLYLIHQNAPAKQYKSYEVAKVYNVEIIRLPVKHCSLNAIELAWSGLKNYVRENNTSFSLKRVEELMKEFCGALGPEEASGYYHHVQKCEDAFKQADAWVESELEPNITGEENDEETSDSEISEEESEK